MAENKYYGPVNMGKLVVGDQKTPVPVPQKPYTEDKNDLFRITPYDQRPLIVDHDTPDGYRIKWHKILYNDIMYLICDRVMAIGIANSIRRYCVDIDTPLKLKDRDYLLTTVNNNTWWDMVRGDIEGIPKPTIVDNNEATWPWDDNKFTTECNKTWNYAKAYSVIYEKYSTDNEWSQIVGNYSQKYNDRRNGSEEAGYRPILKLLPFGVSISGEDIDLGIRPWPFLHTYKVFLGYKENPVTLKIYIDESLEHEEILNQDTDKQFDISDYWNDLDLGAHVLILEASDVDTTIPVTRKVTFYKSVNKPDLLPDKPSMQQVSETIENTGYYLDYLKTKTLTQLKETISNIY